MSKFLKSWTRTVTLAAAALVATTVAACGGGGGVVPQPSATPSRQTLRVVGSGNIIDGQLRNQLQMQEHWHETVLDPTKDSLDVSRQGERCTANTVNLPADPEQYEALRKFVEEHQIPRFDPVSGEQTTMPDKAIGWACSADGSSTTVFSAQGDILVLGNGSKVNPQPYGKNLQQQLDDKGRGRLLQGAVVAGFQMGNQGFFLLGSDNGWFGLGKIPNNPRKTDASMEKNAVTAALVTESGHAYAAFVNDGGGRAPQSITSVPTRVSQHIMVAHDGTDQGKVEATQLYAALTLGATNSAQRSETPQLAVVGAVAL